MENMTDYQYAWALYLIGALGCSLAAWLLFRRFGRAVTHFFVITVMVIVFTPYAIDAETMTMAPAMYSLVFGFMDGGFVAIKPILKLMLGLWGCALILSLLYQLLTRPKAVAHYDEPEQHQTSRRSGRNQAYRNDERDYERDYDYSPQTLRANSGRGLSREERIARDELLREEPIRAIR